MKRHASIMITHIAILIPGQLAGIVTEAVCIRSVIPCWDSPMMILNCWRKQSGILGQRLSDYAVPDYRIAHPAIWRGYYPHSFSLVIALYRLDRAGSPGNYAPLGVSVESTLFAVSGNHRNYCRIV